MKIVNGLAFPDEDEYLVSKVSPEGHYQRANLDAAMRFVRGRTLAVDGGASVGTWTLPMSKWFDRVVCFEPAADTFECLVYNLRGVSNVELHEQALGKKLGMVSMTLEGHRKAIALKNTAARFVKAGGTIPCMRLDGLRLPALDFLKLDVEGSEVDALLGAEKTVRKFKPVVLFEDKGQWSRFGYERRAPHKLLSSWGMKCFVERIGTDSIWGW